MGSLPIPRNQSKGGIRLNEAKDDFVAIPGEKTYEQTM